jgi:hypothetical protein
MRVLWYMRMRKFKTGRAFSKHRSTGLTPFANPLRTPARLTQTPCFRDDRDHRSSRSRDAVIRSCPPIHSSPRITLAKHQKLNISHRFTKTQNTHPHQAIKPTTSERLHLLPSAGRIPLPTHSTQQRIMRRTPLIPNIPALLPRDSGPSGRRIGSSTSNRGSSRHSSSPELTAALLACGSSSFLVIVRRLRCMLAVRARSGCSGMVVVVGGAGGVGGGLGFGDEGAGCEARGAERAGEVVHDGGHIVGWFGSCGLRCWG